MTRTLLASAMALACIAASAGTALATHKAGHTQNNPDAPGQDRVCLVTTDTPGTFNNVNVTSARMLPRRAAETQAAGSGDAARVFTYGTGGSRTEEVCNCLNNPATRATCS